MTTNSDHLTNGGAHYKACFDNLCDGLIIITGKGDIQEANDQATVLTGCPSWEMTKGNLKEFLHPVPDNLRTALAHLKALVNNKKARDILYLRRHDGTALPVEVNSTALDNNSYLCRLQDISAREKEKRQLLSQLSRSEQQLHLTARELKLANEKLVKEVAKHNLRKHALQDIQRRYDALLKALPVGVFLCDGAGQLVYTNEQARILIGGTAPKLNPMPRLHPDDVKPVQAQWETHLQERKPFRMEYRFVHPDGKVVWVMGQAIPFRGQGERRESVGTLADITSLKEAEEALRLSEERFYTAFNSSPSVMAIRSLEAGRCLDVNQQFVQVTGYSRSEVLGKTFQQVKLCSDNQELLAALDNKQAFRNREVTLVTKSGEEKLLLASGEIISINGSPCLLLVLQDITRYKLLEREMARLDRLNVVAEMAAGIGHEVRNPMTTVRGFLQLLMEKKELHSAHDYLQLMIEELDRANSIISQFLSLTKNKPMLKKQHNLNDILNTLKPLIQSDALEAGHDIRLELTDVPDLLMDQEEIRQLILNLVRNGIEAMSSGGLLSIRTFIDGGDTVLSVTDQGPGIDTEILEKLGTPFFTTKDHGTGLGLPVSFSIAERHNAVINIDTGPEGSIFEVRFKNHQP